MMITWIGGTKRLSFDGGTISETGARRGEKIFISSCGSRVVQLYVVLVAFRFAAGKGYQAESVLLQWENGIFNAKEINCFYIQQCMTVRLLLESPFPEKEIQYFLSGSDPLLVKKKLSGAKLESR